MDGKLQNQPESELEKPARSSKRVSAGRRRGLQVVVPKGESREYILTNKEKAYFAGETGTTNTRSYEGLIVELHKFLEGWDLLVGDRPLSASGVRNACVLPQSMTREHILEQTTETVFLADGSNVLILTYSSNHRGRAAFLPRVDIRSIREERTPEYVTQWDPGRRVLALRRSDHAERTRDQDYPVWVAIACDLPVDFVPEAAYQRTTYTKDAARRAMGSAVPYSPGRLEFRFEGDRHFPSSVTFGIGVGDDLDEAVSLARRGIQDEFSLYDAKMRRVSDAMDEMGLAMSDGDYRYSLLWAAASIDGLIMNQMGRGIFAGLHWFPDYWGRDTFVSLPGACLVRGEFEAAREILETFAGLQVTDDSNPLLGRIPNLASPGATYYNTADGTWWFVRAACEYVRYSGDIEFARWILRFVERAIEGALSRRVDDDLLLRHGQAETWMDAGGEARPHSPRGDRAVEVEVLWYTALRSGSDLARATGRSELARRWADLAHRVRDSFEAIFWDEHRARLHDHIDPDGTPDRKLRPNQLLAVTVPWDSLIPPEKRAETVRLVADTCVLPHGVASLAPSDSDFHPRHLDFDRYHFDEAYHSGDVWVWLTGPAVTAFVRNGLVGSAWDQTRVVSDLVFDEGAAGTLPELRDGVPPESGDNVAGAVSQAWSLAEFLRNFYQDYLGVVPDLLSGELRVHPALPPGLSWVKARVRVGHGHVDLSYEVADEGGEGRFTLSADRGVPAIRVRFSAAVPLVAHTRSWGAESEASLEPGEAIEFVVAEKDGQWCCSVESVDQDSGVPWR